jgi:hypothetical protein
MKYLLAFALLAAVAVASTAGARALTPPANTSPPTISGTATEGQTLTASSGSWSGTTPISYSYLWKRCNSSGGNCNDRTTGQTYSLKSGDVGHRMRVSVTATNSDGSSSAISSPTAVVSGLAPANTSPPKLSGTARDGQKLSVTKGSWDNNPTSFAYGWLRCDSAGSNCSPISGQTGSEYRLVSADVGHRTQATVTATNQYGSNKASSNVSDVVVAKGLGPASTSPPVVSGSAQVGQKLTLSQGSWSGSTPMSFSYGWQRCDSNGNNCAAISTATQATYTVASADLGHRLRGFVRASNSFGASTATSVPTAVVTQGLPPGAIRLPNGTISVPVGDVSLPDLLVIDRVSFSPSLLRSRAPFTGQFRVVDLHGYVVRGVYVYALGVPFGRIQNAPEVVTGQDGVATIQLVPTGRLPLIRGGSLVIFVRARKPGDNVLAGVTARRLVSVRTAHP